MVFSKEVEMDFLDLAGGRLAFEVSGPRDGALVVGMHGMGDSRAAFRYLTPLLTEAGYRVAVVDARGHGASSAPWPTYSQEAQGADLLALVRHLGGPAVLIGNSAGAGAAAFAAAMAPQEVSSLILISTFASAPKLNPLLRAAQGLVMRSPRLWSMYFRSLFTTVKPADLDAYLADMRAVLRQPGRMAAVRGMIAPGDSPWTSRAGDITCPVLIVHGTKDPDYPDPEAEARLAAQYLTPTAASVTVEMIEGAGHYPQAEMPEVTAAALLRFLDATPPV
jgi:pimeloyl-ACP methyl ester carboxylesterase